MLAEETCRALCELFINLGRLLAVVHNKQHRTNCIALAHNRHYHTCAILINAVCHGNRLTVLVAYGYFFVHNAVKLLRNASFHKLLLGNARNGYNTVAVSYCRAVT